MSGRISKGARQWSMEGWGGVMGIAPAKNHDFNDILSVFSSFLIITGKVLLFSIIIQHILTSFCSCCDFFCPPPHHSLRVLAGMAGGGSDRLREVGGDRLRGPTAPPGRPTRPPSSYIVVSNRGIKYYNHQFSEQSW